MNRTRISLIDVLQPRQFKVTPERSKVTRTIIQPEIDAFEEQEALLAAQKSALAESTTSRRAPTRFEKSALAGRHPEAAATH
ncbi:MAG: hypothetical protein QMD73_00130 [Rhodocyclaceae bacterium]|nr:hypothetical protein [Rhodocyclaceae bacterium]